jgi:RimJ/RimL family protein N-acetyltransferase
MSQPAVPDSADWERRWTVDAGSVIRRLTAVTGAENTASRRLLERQGFHLTGPLPGTDEVRYILSLT